VTRTRTSKAVNSFLFKKMEQQNDIPFKPGTYSFINNTSQNFCSKTKVTTNLHPYHLPSLCFSKPEYKKVAIELDNQGFNQFDIEKIFSSFPLFFKEIYTIRVPNKVFRVLDRYYKKEYLDNVHTDKQTAIELCLLFLTNLNDSYYRSGKNCIFAESGWKTLYSKILRNQLMYNDRTYLDIIECLKDSEKPIIERSSNYSPEEHYSYKYRLTETYFKKGWSNYTLTTELAKKLAKDEYVRKFKAAMDNEIARNLIAVYDTIELPTQVEIKQRAKELVKSKFITKKGKRLVFRNKHSDDYFKNIDVLSFVEDDIELWDSLFVNGEKMIPVITEENNGHRVIDSFTLAPSWIRNMCKINGKTLEECDYSALHPNIAMTIYGGNMKYITHQQVSDETGINIKDVKKEHLSFFNKELWQMGLSPLLNYYNSKDRAMVTRIMNEKNMTDKGHKITSQRMFLKETEIMTEVIKRLNSQGIYVLYIYDALMCEQEHKEKVIEVMNEVALENGVYTTAK